VNRLYRSWICALTWFWEGGSGAQLADLMSSMKFFSVALCTGADECKMLERLIKKKK
jgi:hypothetical protein